MSDTTFVDGVTVIPTTWAQDVNNTVYRALGSGGVAPTNAATVLSNIGAQAAATAINTGNIASQHVALADNATNATNATTATTATSATRSTYAPQIQVVSSSVAGNALTVGYSGGVLDFRSATATSGAITAITVGSLSLTVPAGATLGTTSGQSARIAIIAINNAGTVEIAVCNLSGGVNLDETSLISTTAISAAATSASVVYSNTARTNVAFRVVGFIDITEATAGTWAAAPALVQGCGGQALAALSSLGYGQRWQNLTSSRAVGATYYNATGKPFAVSVYLFITAPSTDVNLTVSGEIADRVNCAAWPTNSYISLKAVIPPGASYVVGTTVGAATLTTWEELR